jgi:hypothetical protein
VTTHAHVAGKGVVATGTVPYFLGKEVGFAASIISFRAAAAKTPTAT